MKLVLVPTFLLALSLAGKHWGPSVSGWLAGLPVVAGPILFFLTLDHGQDFAAQSASAALSAVLASVTFSIAYAHAGRRLGWPLALATALLAWLLAAFVLSRLPINALYPLGISLATLIVAPYLFPIAKVERVSRPTNAVELGCRMVAGAVLTLAVTLVAGELGGVWSGLLAVFPVLGVVLAVFSHRSEGAEFAAVLLRAMVTGLFSFVAFCFVLAVALRHTGVPAAFTAALSCALAVQVLTGWRLRRHSDLPTAVGAFDSTA